MEYKRKKIEENTEEFFIYKPKFMKKSKQKKDKKISKDSPFEKLSELRFR